MTTPSQDQMAAHFEFARLATQYYASGRFAALSHCIPVAGNLLHHSIEMFLKCFLVKTLTLKELKTLGHNLSVLWSRFSQLHPDPTHATLDSAVAELEKFERLRYPDSIVLEGMQVSFVISKAHYSPLPAGPQPPYHLVLEDIDNIAKIVANASGLKRTTFTSGLSAQALKFLQVHNEHPLCEEA
jgi:hypothetical protein